MRANIRQEGVGAGKGLFVQGQQNQSPASAWTPMPDDLKWIENDSED